MNKIKLGLPIMLVLLLCACAPAQPPSPTALPQTAQLQTAQPQTVQPAATPLPELRIEGAGWVPDGTLVSARYGDYTTGDAALALSQAELNEFAALLAEASEAGEDAARGGAFLGTRLHLEVRTGEGMVYTAALDPTSDGRVNVTLSQGGEWETRVLDSADLVSWVQRVTGWALPTAEEIAAMERVLLPDGRALDPVLVASLRALAVPDNAIASDGLSDPVYVTVVLSDGSTLRGALDAACGDRFALANQVYEAPQDFYTYDAHAGEFSPA